MALLEVMVLARHQVADDVVAVELGRIDERPLPPFTAGSHVDLHLGRGLIRQYSLCGAPAGTYRIGVLKTADSRGGSEFVHQRLRPGHFVLMSEPVNNFPLAAHAAHSVLFAGGIGITPVLAMCRELAARGAGFDVHYSARTDGRLAFADELRTLAGPDHLHLYRDEHGETVDPQQVLAVAPEGTHVYSCGPRGFLDLIDTATKHLPESHVHRELFTNAVDLTGTPFTVIARRSGVRTLVGADQTIAEALLANGVEVPTACETGVCGTCLTRVIAGIPDHRDVYQSPAAQATNRNVTLCCSRSRTDTLTVDI